MADVGITIQGLQDLERRCNGDSLLGPPLREMFDLTGRETRDKARELAPKDTRELADSIVYEVDGAAIPHSVRIRATAKQAPFAEYGTMPHYPPIASIEGWALRHGVNPYALQQSIGRKGTRAHPFMAPAYREMLARVTGRMGGVATAIGRLWRGG